MAQPGKHQKKIRKDSWKDYFALSHRVKRGLMVLFSLILGEIFILLYLNFTPSSAEITDADKFKKEIDAFYASHPAQDSADENTGPPTSYPAVSNSSVSKKLTAEKTPAAYFPFNPNHLPDTAWKRMGFSEKQIRSIKNYEAKGGTFKSKEDVRKMYAIRKEEFSRIEPYISIPEKGPLKVKAEKAFLMVDVGTADSTELEKLPMIGTYMARKIFMYREKLGGFYSVQQLKEVWGMRDSVYSIILPHLILRDSTNLRKINVNTADYSELSHHPYLKSELVNLVLNYRKQHGPFSSTDQLRKVPLVDEELYRKIAPYLKVE